MELACPSLVYAFICVCVCLVYIETTYHEARGYSVYRISVWHFVFVDIGWAALAVFIRMYICVCVFICCCRPAWLVYRGIEVPIQT